VVHGDATPTSTAWSEPVCHRLKYEPSEHSLDEHRHLIKRAEVDSLSPEAVATMQTQLDYLEKRQTMITELAIDVSEVLPYLNVTLRGAIYHRSVNALPWKKNRHAIAFHALCRS
jgi:hypothetical protein